jgi:NTP pyrophosphatase (non-canonical NTP hydrolase)
MTDEMRFLCGDILKYYGEQHQQEKSIEEMAELISAIKHGDRKNYIEELADVGVMLEQLVQALSLEERATFIKTQNSKILRQKERISGEEWKPDDLVEQAFRQGYEKGKQHANK